MTPVYGPLHCAEDGALLGRPDRSGGCVVFDREGVRPAGREGLPWDTIAEANVHLAIVGVPYWAALTASVVLQGPGVDTTSRVWVLPASGAARSWSFEVPKPSQVRWSRGVLGSFLARLGSTGRIALLGTSELTAAVEALHEVPRFPVWSRDRAIGRLVAALPAGKVAPALGRRVCWCGEEGCARGV